jgi:tRNA (guanine37-N1)-methyltransferase
MHVEILTIFPDYFASPLRESLLGKAIEVGRVSVTVTDLRSFAEDRHRKVDDEPYGGGAGMVMMAPVVVSAIEARRDAGGERAWTVLLTPEGRRLEHAVAASLAVRPRLLLVCGRYEGIDERVSDLLADEELSIGDYVLSGGELAAAVVLDATARLLPGVLGHADSSRYESFGIGDDSADSMTSDGVPRSTHGAGGLLDYPHYTRPAEFRGVAIPEVLGGGDHAAIRKWRRQMALEKTWRNRPDLLANAALTDDDREFLHRLDSTTGR